MPPSTHPSLLPILIEFMHAFVQRFRHDEAILMRLYQHSAHCSVALRAFLDDNPMYWCFIPIPWDQSPTTDDPHPTDNPPPVRTIDRAQVMRCLRHVPAPPTAHFFSQRQRKMQHSFFDYFLSLDHEQQRPYRALDLFRVNIIVVRKCSGSYSTDQSDFTASLSFSPFQCQKIVRPCYAMWSRRCLSFTAKRNWTWSVRSVAIQRNATAALINGAGTTISVIESTGTPKQRTALCNEVQLGMPSPSFSLPLTFVFRSMNYVLFVSCRFVSRYTVCVTL